MALSIYKPGQGYWTRTLSAVGAGVLLLACVGWLWKELSVIGDDQTRMIAQSVMAVTLIAGLGGLVFWLLNKPNIADFLIATETEMKKVNWPTRRELIGSTWVVICGTLMFAAFLWVVDILFFFLFSRIGILVGF